MYQAQKQTLCAEYRCGQLFLPAKRSLMVHGERIEYSPHLWSAVSACKKVSYGAWGEDRIFTPFKWVRHEWHQKSPCAWGFQVRGKSFPTGRGRWGLREAIKVCVVRRYQYRSPPCVYTASLSTV
jgi:hypothetical protein